MPHPQGYLLRAIRHIPAKARSGLYAGKQVGVANRVSREYEVRSKKYVKPNVVKRRLFSQALGRSVQLHVTTTALRRIDAAGGLDRYLLKTPDSLLFSDVGSDLKFRLGLIYKNKLLEQQQQRARSNAGCTQLSSSAPARLAAGGTSIAPGGASIPAGGSSISSSTPGDS